MDRLSAELAAFADAEAGQEALLVCLDHAHTLLRSSLAVRSAPCFAVPVRVAVVLRAHQELVLLFCWAVLWEPH